MISKLPFTGFTQFSFMWWTACW